MIRNNQFYALDTIVDFRPLGLFVERSAVSVDYCRYMAIVELWKILSLLFAKDNFEEKTSLNGLNFASKYCSNIWCHCSSTINMSMYRVDNLRMVISEIISFSYGSSLYKWEEAGGKKQVLAEFAWKNYFCRLEMIGDQKKGDSGHFYESVEK